MFQYAKQNEESLLPPGEGQDEGIINGKLHDPLTPTLSLREREPSGKTYLPEYSVVSHAIWSLL